MKDVTQREKQKLQSRAKIIKAAASLFGKQGIQATGIDQIMKKAGLTAGAFYAHFKSKDHLIEEVVWLELPRYKEVKTEDFLAYYLTAEHRDHPEAACPLATLGSDLARADRALRKRVASRLNEVILERTKRPAHPGKKKALMTLSIAVGALILSRITQDTELSDEFLKCYE